MTNRTNHTFPGMPLAFVFIALLFAWSSPVAAQCADLPGCVLVWSDEFDGTEVDTGKWTFQLGDGTEVGLPGGWETTNCSTTVKKMRLWTVGY